MWVNFIKKYQNLVFSRNEKSQNKVGVAEEIGCENYIVLSKIGRGNEKLKSKKVFSLVPRKSKSVSFFVNLIY